MNRFVVIAVVFSVMLLLLPVAATTPDPVIPTTGVVFTHNTVYSVHGSKPGYSNSSTYSVVL